MKSKGGECGVKAVRYLYNLLRLGRYKLLGRYRGTLLQGIPLSTQMIVAKGGSLELGGRISCRRGCYISALGQLSIGEGCFINNHAQIVSMARVHIGKNVLIGPNVVIVDHDHDYRSADRMHAFTTTPVEIGDNVWIGANAVIMKGSSIGAGSVVGAGIIVKGSFPERSLIYQERATTVKQIEGQPDVRA